MALIDTYKKRLSSSLALCTPHWNRAIDNYKHYLGRIDTGGTYEGDYPFTSKTSMSISYEVVETVMPRIIGRDPEFLAVAVEPSDSDYERDARMALELGYNNPKLEIRGEPIYLKLQRGTKEQLITGNVVYRPYWRRETIKQVRYVGSLKKAGIENSPDLVMLAKRAKELNDKVSYQKQIIDAPFLDDFDLRHVPFFMYMPDAQMVDRGRMRYEIERDYMTFEEFAAEAERFSYDSVQMAEIQAMKDNGRMGFTPDTGKDFLHEYNDLFQTLDQGAFKTDDDKMPLLIVDKMWEGYKVHVIVNEKFVMTGEEGIKNPYDVMVSPFIHGHDVVLPHSYFSYGEIDSIKKIEDGINDLTNMRFDNLLQSMLNIWLVNPKMVDSTDEFVPIPNSITSVLDVDKAVRSIQGRDVTPTIYREIQELYGTIQRITGMNDYTKGVEGDTIAGRTYGGMRLVQEAANARFIIKSRLFEKVTLKALGYFILEFSKQFINEDRIRRQFGDHEVEEKSVRAAHLKSIKGLMDIKVLPNSARAIDEQAEAMKLNTLYDRMVAGKGPFENVPSEIFDKFLLKYLPLYGIHDAIYWVRVMREERDKQSKGLPEEGGEGALPPPPMPMQLPQGQPMMGGNEVIQSNGVMGGQPNPLEQIINSQGLNPAIS